MELLFKITGMFLLFCASSFGGFFKTFSLKKRVEILGEINRSLGRLAGFISARQGETEKLVNLSFPPHVLKMENGKFIFDTLFLEKGDIALINEFLRDLGANDTQNEYERTLSYAELFRNLFTAAEEKFSALGRLYSTSGVLCGVLICIFFI